MNFVTPNANPKSKEEKRAINIASKYMDNFTDLGGIAKLSNWAKKAKDKIFAGGFYQRSGRI